MSALDQIRGIVDPWRTVEQDHARKSLDVILDQVSLGLPPDRQNVLSKRITIPLVDVFDFQPSRKSFHG
ncbi:hypothetical protein IWQ52_004281 [Labrenzia sp. EL_159]|nr:hypothetical protein [Labrenzia sp. EL_162]MBG6196745.1 hypothetical protein [Labrenzia sp. EL_159]